jgi:hypothetical protein
MKQAQQQQSKRSFPIVLALVSLLGGAAWLSCQPGELPCDSTPEWQAVCKREGGAGGTGGGSPMGGAGGMAPVVNKDTAVMDCAQWKTLGEMDKFFSARCAGDGAATQCHVSANAAAWNDFTAADIWMRLKDQPPKFACKGGGSKLINTATWADSVILAKAKAGAGTPMCPAGSNTPGLGMPPQSTFMPKMDVLSADETKCLENYLKAIAGK